MAVGAERRPGRARAASGRGTPILRQITLLLVLPLLTLVVLFGYTATNAVNAVVSKSRFTTSYDRLALPVAVAIQAIKDERAAAVGVLSAQPGTIAAFTEKAKATDATVAAFRASTSTEKMRDAMDAPSVERLENLYRAFEGLAALRGQINAREIDPVTAIDTYGGLCDDSLELVRSMTIATADDVPTFRQTEGVIDTHWAQDYMLRERDLLTTLPGDGRMTVGDRIAFSRWAENRDRYLDRAVGSLSGEPRAVLLALVAQPSFQTYLDAERDVVGRGVNLRQAPTLQQWRAASTEIGPLWLQENLRTGALVDADVQRIGDETRHRLILTAGVGLLAVLASIALSVRFARRLSGELSALHRSAQDLAKRKLPGVVGRLRRGEEVDVAAEAPPLAGGRTKEISSLADAFGRVQHTAIDLAVGEAYMRRNIGKIFVNLSWRSQTLLQRQLHLLETMEREATGSDELDRLFRLDHLTTRMRRHAEGLVILSGAPTVRAWDLPVSAEDVVRAAIGEVEDYQRVEISAMPAVAFTGETVADIIHLLAELIENATAFSPPGTEVTVKGGIAANGLVIEVIDRGIGVHPDQLAILNHSLAEAPEFDLADTDRLGVFVVARLAARHGIRVVLQQSPYGGTSAVVLVPPAFVVTPVEPRTRARNAAGRVTAPSAPPPRLPTSAPAPGPGPAPGPDDGLPRRVPRQNMAAQLREGVARGPEPEPFADPDPEASRDLMSALQSGWELGQNTADPAGESEGKHGKPDRLE
ncbi:sensor histidine kinase [Actinocorallia longicatena]|uniref:histidine kinase n=1 Tax=Actinocorallia longicatena TaxID=111803 RepID=A0ABP6QID3_9ACTN